MFKELDYCDETEKDDGTKTDDSSVYAESDEERMSAHSIDDERPNFSVFNEDVDMERPVFEFGKMFKSSQIFRKAMRTHAIIEKRPITLVRNFGRKV